MKPIFLLTKLFLYKLLKYLLCVAYIILHIFRLFHHLLFCCAGLTYSSFLSQ